ncbi:uncharacterized protein FTOL_05185 [Fusarium torulosum]|uniref:Mitochondrial division protein 1 n=1 Tax=Fusarium torulosum TaxID=33205 RepID=A0AAE8M795_9HYPO|nr:uncharacterized protein FTOL_05185 [Fusarium torulosum]
MSERRLKNNIRATLNTLKAHDWAVRCLAILDNSTVVSGSRDGTIRLWTLESGQLESRSVLRGHAAENLYGHIRRPGSKAKNASHLRLVGDALISGGADGSVKSWALSPIDASPRELASSEGDGTAISTTRVQGRHTIAVTTGGSVKIIDCQSGETLHSWTNETCGIAVSQVGFTLEHNPVAVYLKDESVQVTVF